MANPDLKPVGETVGTKFRTAKVQDLAGYYFDGLKSSPFMDQENTREIFAGTQFEGENHRRVTPHLQALFMEKRRPTMNRLDGYAAQMPFMPTVYDVIIIGSGPHGAAVASYLREKRPKTKILLLDSGKIGGQFRSYGDKPAFFMNSRVRKADRRLPSLPRTDGSINPLGEFAPLELSDVNTSLYPSNTDMGDVVALNGYVSADKVLSNFRVEGVDYNYSTSIKADKRVIGKAVSGQSITFYGKIIVDATGMKMQSRIVTDTMFPGRTEYFTGASFYKHFGTHVNPLKMFHDARVMVVGAGDTALTAMEALIGQLPGTSYGMGSVGRYRPRSIVWWGAPRSDRDTLSKTCFRSRYKNGLPQALGTTARPGIIQPVRGAVREVAGPTSFYFEVTGDDSDLGARRYEYPNILIDCTRQAMSRQNDWMVDFRIGPENGMNFSQMVLRTLENLGIPENNVSLWATMPQTNIVSESILGRLSA